ncbi:TetR/AcrR family transcriptional regulator [Streptomyces mirabilis]|uniref:TetR/AcrR family transcriptional regulator n=1 Tax=Streptomyces mirabilis TaxID=68239 RepID=UPI002E1CBF00
MREAASELFAEHGFATTSTRSRAAPAGLSPAVVTRHIGSKQGQRAAVDEYVLDRIGEQLRDLDSVQPGRGPMVQRQRPKDQAAHLEGTTICRAAAVAGFAASAVTRDQPLSSLLCPFFPFWVCC